MNLSGFQNHDMPLVYCFLKLTKYYCKYKSCPQTQRTPFCRAVEEVWVPALLSTAFGWIPSTFQGCLTAAPTLGRKGVWPGFPGAGPSCQALPYSLLISCHCPSGHARHCLIFSPGASDLGSASADFGVLGYRMFWGCLPPRGGRRNTLGFSRVLHAHRPTCRGLECGLLFRFMLNELCKAVSGLCPKTPPSRASWLLAASWTEK